MDTARKTPRECVALGFLGALLFSLAGTAAYVFFCYEGYYPWPAGGAAPVAAILGYGIFSGKKGSGKGLIAAAVFSVLALLLGAYLSLVIDLHNALQEEHMAATTGQLFLLTLALLTAIILRCLYVARHAKTQLEGYACIGVASVIIFQVIINVGMCLFVMPVIGLTLPFISYGGSSLVMLFACMGLVSGVHGRAKPDWLR